ERTLDRAFDAARAEYRAALALWEGPKSPVLCQWAVLEMKAGDAARAEALLAQARAEPGQRLATGYTLLCEAVRAKLPPARRKEFAAAFDAELAQAPAPAETLVLLETAARQRHDRLDAFHGQKTRERNLIKFLETLPLASFDEGQLERLGASLLVLQARKALDHCLRHAEGRFPRNPTFRLLSVDYYLTGRSPANYCWVMKRQLEHARKAAEALPRGERQQQLLERIRAKEAQVQEVCGSEIDMMGMFNPIFETIFGESFDEDFDEDEA